MEQIAEQAKKAATLPSQGEATVYNALNVHTDPSRQSTSFHQITEGMLVDVVAHKLVPRTNTPPPAFRIERKAPPPRKKKREPEFPPPPRPAAPKPPDDWLAISKTVFPEPEPEPELLDASGKKRKKKRRREPPKVPVDDWYLVRTQNGKAGWVLARNTTMAIPDEVAQYSEGARITSYFALADVQDGDQTKHHWLWTTIRDGGQPYQFDSFRVFTWVVRKHRFETAYIERDIEGYYPVEVVPGKIPRFSLILREDDGKLYRRTYIMEGYLVRKIADEPYEAPGEEPGSKVISNLPPEDHTDVKPSLADRIRGFFHRTSAR
jgi:hypothetical protein